MGSSMTQASRYEVQLLHVYGMQAVNAGLVGQCWVRNLGRYCYCNCSLVLLLL